MSVQFVAPREPLVDIRTGLITRTWYLLFQALFTGGGIDNADIALIAPVPSLDAMLEAFRRLISDEQQGPVATAFILDDPQQPPVMPEPWREALALLGSVRDEVAMLRSAIEDLQKGPL